MLKAGAAKVDITPFIGGPMAGYGGRDKGSETVHDPTFRGASPTLVVSLSNDGLGYVCTRRAYPMGGYEPSTSALRPGAGELLVKEAIALAGLVGRKRRSKTRTKG